MHWSLVAIMFYAAVTCHFKSGSFIISKKRGMISSLAHAYLYTSAE